MGNNGIPLSALFIIIVLNGHFTNGLIEYSPMTELRKDDVQITEEVFFTYDAMIVNCSGELPKKDNSALTLQIHEGPGESSNLSLLESYKKELEKEIECVKFEAEKLRKNPVLLLVILYMGYMSIAYSNTFATEYIKYYNEGKDVQDVRCCINVAQYLAAFGFFIPVDLVIAGLMNVYSQHEKKEVIGRLLQEIQKLFGKIRENVNENLLLLHYIETGELNRDVEYNNNAVPAELTKVFVALLYGVTELNEKKNMDALHKKFPSAAETLWEFSPKTFESRSKVRKILQTLEMEKAGDIDSRFTQPFMVSLIIQTFGFYSEIFEINFLQVYPRNEQTIPVYFNFKKLLKRANPDLEEKKNLVYSSMIATGSGKKVN